MGHNRELKQPRRQREGKRHFKNDFQIFQNFRYSFNSFSLSNVAE